MEFIGETSKDTIIAATDRDRVESIYLQAHVYKSKRPYYFAVKRFLDITVSSTLIVLQIPLYLMIALAIKLDSKGPVLIRQRRIGRNRRQESSGAFFMEKRREDLRGRPFIMYKFRSMHVDSKLYDVKPLQRNDSRVTRVGRFLRRSCLDELPQLINVFRGEMSLVGPRPELAFIVKGYNDYQALRLESKPGITGMWQLYGSRERHIHEDVHLDLEYIQKQSLRTDLKILFNTLRFALRMKNH